MTALIRVFVVLALITLPSMAYAQSVRRDPSLVLKDIQGRTFRLDDYRGKVVMLNFWATWCPPCRAEIPELVKWQREYKELGLQVIGITYPPQKLSTVRRFARTFKVNYPIALGTKATKSFFDAGESLPMTVVIDNEGNVREVIQGVLFAEEFDQKIKPLLR